MEATPLPCLIKEVVDAAVDATAVVDLDLRVLHFNRAYATLLGMRERELRRSVLTGVCHERLRLETCRDRCVARRALALGRSVRVDEVASESEGMRLVITAVPLRGDDGEPRAVLETYRDVTAESRMQAQYKELIRRERRQNEILQEEVRRRTAELTRSLEELTAARAQLVHSEKMSSLGQLVAGIAHELNNPINFIYGNMEFLEQHIHRLLRVVDAVNAMELPIAMSNDLARLAQELELDFVRVDLPALIGSIRDGAERVATIVHELRTFSRATTTEHRDCDLNQGITATLNLVKQQAKGRVTLVRDLRPLPSVRCNLAQINQVIMNVVVNAIQSIESEGTVIVRSRATDDGAAAIEIEDDGCGIAPDVLTKVFDPFFTTKEVGKGTGLGLSISYGIVQAHHGRLEVESEVGKGSRFTLILPVGGPAVWAPDAKVVEARSYRPPASGPPPRDVG